MSHSLRTYVQIFCIREGETEAQRGEFLYPGNIRDTVHLHQIWPHSQVASLTAYVGWKLNTVVWFYTGYFTIFNFLSFSSIKRGEHFLFFSFLRWIWDSSVWERMAVENLLSGPCLGYSPKLGFWMASSSFFFPSSLPCYLHFSITSILFSLGKVAPACCFSYSESWGRRITNLRPVWTT